MKKSRKFSQPQDESRSTNVLLEEMRSNFKLLAEGQQGIVEHMDRTDEHIDRVEAKIDEFRKDVTMVLKNHEARLHTLETAR